MGWGVICTLHFITACKSTDINDVIFLIRTLEYNLIYVHLWALHKRYHQKPMHFTPTVSVEHTEHTIVFGGFHMRKGRPPSVFSEGNERTW